MADSEGAEAEYGCEARAILHGIDTDKNGVVELSELQDYLSDFGLTDAQIEDLLHELDQDGNGVIDEAEWIRGYDAIISKTGRARFRDLVSSTGGYRIEDTALRAVSLAQLEKIYAHVVRRLKKAPWKVNPNSKPSSNHIGRCRGGPRTLGNGGLKRSQTQS